MIKNGNLGKNCNEKYREKTTGENPRKFRFKFIILTILGTSWKSSAEELNIIFVTEEAKLCYQCFVVI